MSRDAQPATSSSSWGVLPGPLCLPSGYTVPETVVLMPKLCQLAPFTVDEQQFYSGPCYVITSQM